MLASQTPPAVDAGHAGWTGLPTYDEHRALIDESHQRSRENGLCINDRPDYTCLSGGQLRHVLDENRFLFQHAAPVMEALYEQIVNTHSTVLLTAADGLILHSLGDNDFLERAAQVALVPGVNWSEKSKGTNAIGTALVEERPIVVRGSEHYLRANHFLACSCAPIFDPHGKLVGALDVTCDERGYHHHTIALVRMSAQMIENQMFANVFPDAVRIHFHSRPEFLGTLMEGIAVFSREGRFLSANRSAQFQLGQSINCLRAHTFSSLFGQTLPQFLDRLRGSVGKPLKMCLWNGVSVWCQARMRQSHSWVVPSALEVTDGGVAMPSRATRSQDRYWEKPSAMLVGQSGMRSSLDALDTGDAQISAVLRKVQMVQGKGIPIMILGETGTGKDMLAKAIHDDSDRAKQPFVAVNCASIPETLIESELFGYEEGAFTGARRKGAVGKIVQANGGTLFLDEIGDMPTPLQARLLRVLQERRVNPLGSNREYEVDIAVVCATHRDLKDLIRRGQFREDLYYRLNGLVVRLPALRERTDFEAVVRKMLGALCERGHQVDIAPEVMALFRRYHWPGNLRQLHNLLRTAVAMVGCDGCIGMDHLPDDFLEEVRTSASTKESSLERLGLVIPAHVSTAGSPAVVSAERSDAHKLEDVALQAMADALRRCRGNVSAAARMLGVSRNTIYRKRAQLPGDVWGN